MFAQQSTYVQRFCRRKRKNNELISPTFFFSFFFGLRPLTDLHGTTSALAKHMYNAANSGEVHHRGATSHGRIDFYIESDISDMWLRTARATGPGS